ncbi:hypothetical protein C8T65DRAFT_664504 [Cerioporus squamosus]|nr:hypothetical protein C8T65DRAFT_664504 [Cerioporus squamosus]
MHTRSPPELDNAYHALLRAGLQNSCRHTGEYAAVVARLLTLSRRYRTTRRILCEAIRVTVFAIMPTRPQKMSTNNNQRGWVDMHGANRTMCMGHWTVHGSAPTCPHSLVLTASEGRSLDAGLQLERAAQRCVECSHAWSNPAPNAAARTCVDPNLHNCPSAPAHPRPHHSTDVRLMQETMRFEDSGATYPLNSTASVLYCSPEYALLSGITAPAQLGRATGVQAAASMQQARALGFMFATYSSLRDTGRRALPARPEDIRRGGRGLRLPKSGRAKRLP